VHGHDDMRLDIQSLINLHPFFEESGLAERLDQEADYSSSPLSVVRYQRQWRGRLRASWRSWKAGRSENILPAAAIRWVSATSKRWRTSICSSTTARCKQPAYSWWAVLRCPLRRAQHGYSTRLRADRST
jgi:hypothetical protein